MTAERERRYSIIGDLCIEQNWKCNFERNDLAPAGRPGDPDVGGDFFDYFAIDDDHIRSLIADVSGKGTPLYGNERLQKVLDEGRHLPGKQVLKNIFDDVCEFATGVPRFDTITMVILTIK